MNPIAYRKIS